MVPKISERQFIALRVRVTGSWVAADQNIAREKQSMRKQGVLEEIIEIILVKIAICCDR